MSDETGAPSAAVSETVATPAPRETPAPEQSDAQRQDANRRLMDRLVRTGRKDDPRPSAPTPKDASRQTDDATEPDFQPPKTRAEYERGIQAEVDRRAAKAQRDAEAKAKKDQERWELDNDPQRVIDRRRQEIEQESEQSKTNQERLAASQAAIDSYDRAVLDPLFLELAEPARNAILQRNAHLTGFENRQAITKETLAALKKQYKAEGAKEAEGRLRSNPALIKQQLVDLRDESEEPVAVSGSSSNGHAPDMNAFIRAGVGKRIR